MTKRVAPCDGPGWAFYRRTHARKHDFLRLQWHSHVTLTHEIQQPMIPTFVFGWPTGEETGDFLAVDLGM
jgi:hypothetical protein